jgi:hypothetical protein
MAALTPVPVAILGLPAGGEYLNQKTTFMQPGAVWNRGDILALTTTGSITNPAPSGANYINFVPSSIATVNPAASTSAGNPGQVLYGFFTYTDGSTGETQPSPEFIINVTSGKTATVTVPADGNYPAGITDFNLYVGILPNGEWQQVAGTALGSPATVPAYPLTNNRGANRAATNASGSIIGYACENYDVTFANRQGSGGQAGNSYRAIFGQDQSGPIGVGFEQYQGYYIDLSNVSIVISLVQGYYPSLLNSTAGLLYNTTAQCFQADTSQGNKILTITGKYGQTNANPGFDPVGQIGDTNALVIARFNSGLLVG